MRTACGFGDMDDPVHYDVCLTCRAARSPWTPLWYALGGLLVVATPFLLVLNWRLG
jgi:hypothetical protein